MPQFLEVLNGFKSFLAGAVVIAAGAYQAYQGDIPHGLQTAGEGLAVWGLAHKVEKMHLAAQPSG